MPGWCMYADTKNNRDDEYNVTNIEFTPCKGAKVNGAIETATVYKPEGTAHYEGAEIEFQQVFCIGREFYGVKDKKVAVKETYHTCNQDMCLPPVTIEETIQF